MEARRTYKFRDLEIVRLYADGLSTYQVADKVGVSDSTVRRALKRQGVPTKSQSEGNALRWTEPDFRANQVRKRPGKPSGALGKTWTVEGRENPSMRGPLNPRWKGGITSLDRAIRTSALYKQWRKSVFERDDYTCQKCGARSRAGAHVRIHAHHIYQFARLLQDHNVECVEDARICDALWCIDNGLTLCRRCHRATDSYGNGGKIE